jgi:hypothetical protein
MEEMIRGEKFLYE